MHDNEPHIYDTGGNDGITFVSKEEYLAGLAAERLARVDGSFLTNLNNDLQNLLLRPWGIAMLASGVTVAVVVVVVSYLIYDGRNDDIDEDEEEEEEEQQPIQDTEEQNFPGIRIRTIHKVSRGEKPKPFLPSTIINNFLIPSNIPPEILKGLNSKFAIEQLKGGVPGKEWEEVISSGGSNGRRMRWAVMDIKKNQKFSLHAHPTIELIYVAKGAMMELRLNCPLPVHPSANFVFEGDTPEGPDLREVKEKWDFNCVGEGGWIVNEVGSIHQTFTGNEAACLVILWGGAHANIQKENQPTDFDFDDAIERCRACGINGMEGKGKGELFLPENEKKKQ